MSQEELCFDDVVKGVVESVPDEAEQALKTYRESIRHKSKTHKPNAKINQASEWAKWAVSKRCKSKAELDKENLCPSYNDFFTLFQQAKAFKSMMDDFCDSKGFKG